MRAILLAKDEKELAMLVRMLATDRGAVAIELALTAALVGLAALIAVATFLLG